MNENFIRDTKVCSGMSLEANALSDYTKTFDAGIMTILKTI